MMGPNAAYRSTLPSAGGIPYADLAMLGYNAFRGGDPMGSLAGAGGAALGGKAGAALGTAVMPGVGTAIGSALGSTVGAAASAIPGMFGGKKAKKKKAAASAPMEAPRQSFDPGFLDALVQGLPQYAGGAARQPGGLAIVGENGPELAFLSPESPVIPMIPRGPQQFDPSGFVEEQAPQMGQRDGFFADVARGLGANPFGQEGSLGGIAQLASQALGGKRGNENFGGRLGLAALGGLGNVLVNRELGQQSEIEKMNERLRERAKLRNTELREIAKENRTSERTRGDKVLESNLRREESADKEAREATSDAAKRRFILSDKVADKLELPRGERVTFEQYTTAYEKAKAVLPKSDMERINAMSPAEWQQYVKRKGELDKATGGAGAPKPATAPQQQELAEHLTTIKQTGNIRSLLKPEFVGPVAGPTGSIALKTGKGLAPGYARFRSALAKYNNAAFKVLAGTAGGKAEADRVLKELASENDPYEVFIDKLAETEKALRTKARTTRSVFKDSGVDVSKLEALPSIQMRTPDGRVIVVPDEQIDEAEARGAVRV